MSELVTRAKCSEGGVLETSLRFQAAVPASVSPALSPTRGSGLGAVVDMPALEADEEEPAHAERVTRASVSTAQSSAATRRAPGRRDFDRRTMEDSSESEEVCSTTGEERVITG